MSDAVARFRNLAAGVFIACGVALAGTDAAADDCHPPIDPALPQYIVGYGSLMETE